MKWLARIVSRDSMMAVLSSALPEVSGAVPELQADIFKGNSRNRDHLSIAKLV
jgi:hypothetical protein